VWNPVFFAIRLAAGATMAGRGAGDTAHFPGLAGKLAMARALVRADWQALRMAPRILRKRAAIERLRKLSPREVRRLIWSNRLSLREVA
jgi:hypothetical protein